MSSLSNPNGGRLPDLPTDSFLSLPESALHPPPSYASLTTPLQPAFPSRPLSGQGPPRTEQVMEHGFSYLGLPSGFFLLRSKAPRQRTFDVHHRATAEGSEICLHPVKIPTVLRGSTTLQNSQNNQVLFLDFAGHLMTASADGRAIDCVDDALKLAIPHPIYPFPSRASHPLPQFSLDPETSTLHVLFACDPSYPGPNPSRTSWMETEYIVEQVPMKRKKEEAWVVPSLLSGIGEKFGSLNLFGKTPTAPAPAPAPSLSAPPLQPPWEQAHSPGTRTVFELPPLPSSSSSHPSSTSDDSDSDDDETAYRPLRVVALPRNWREKFPSEALSHSTSSLGLAPTGNRELRRWRRRQWECVPIVVRPIDPSPSPLPPPPRPVSGARSPAPRPLHLAGSASPANPQRWSTSSALSGGATSVGSSPERTRRIERRSGSPPLPSVPREEGEGMLSRTESWADAKVLPEIGVGMLGRQSEGESDEEEEVLGEEVVHEKAEVEVEEEKVALESDGEESEREGDDGGAAESSKVAETWVEDVEDEPAEEAGMVSDDASSDVAAGSLDEQSASEDEKVEDVKDEELKAGEATDEEADLEEVEIVSAQKGKGKEPGM